MEFLAYLSKNLTNPAFNFCAFGRKTQILWKFWENVRKFWKDFLRKLQKMHYLHYRPRKFFRGGGSEDHKGGLVRGSPSGGFRGAEPPGRLRSFQKIWKKSMKKLQFLKNFQENFAILKIWFNFYRIFGEDLDRNLENLEIRVCRGFGGLRPPTPANFWKSE